MDEQRALELYSYFFGPCNIALAVIMHLHPEV